MAGVVSPVDWAVKKAAAVAAEIANHKARQELKDKEFAELLQSIERQSAQRNHSIKVFTFSSKKMSALSGNLDLEFEFQDTKSALASHPLTASAKKISELKREREKSMQLDSKESAELLGRLAATYRTLELNSTAHELDAWCEECGCVHVKDVVVE